MAKKILGLLLVLYSTLISAYAQPQSTLTGVVQDAQTKEILDFATVQLMNGKSTSYGAITNDKGHFEIKNIKPGKYTLVVSFLGYNKFEQRLNINHNLSLTIPLQSSSTSLNEVVVTAAESKGVTSASKIDRTAMEHLQPSSFTDLLELLPGGKSVDPAMNQANLVSIREAKTSTGYSNPSEVMSSLGVSFVVDGVPIDNDANLQYMPGTSSDNSRNYVSKGVDMRTVSTDNIESVEVVRGIPSVEYGELTSGIIKIKRKQEESPFEARFKADEYGKLFSAGKGFYIGKEQKHILNADVSYMDAKSDPRNSLENYKRLTGSLRMQANRQTDKFNSRWEANIDYSGSFDSQKYDPDILKQKDDSYKSTYNKFTIGGGWGLSSRNEGFFRSAEIRGSVSQEVSRITQVKRVSLDRPTAILNFTESGVYDVEYLPYEYLTDMTIDGKPLNAFVKAIGKFNVKLLGSNHSWMAGTEWRLQKNRGDGQVYDVTRPLYPSSSNRPRAYKDIPADSKLSFFIEDNINLPVGNNHLNLTAGIRSLNLLGLRKEFAMKGKIYLDPRMNVQWKFPLIGSGKRKWSFDISGGVGLTTKAPTLAMLYPDPYYVDITQLNYYHNNPDYRRMNIRTYKWDNTNYDLKPARNLKWEVKLGASYGQNNFSVTYFRERMKDGFRSDSYWKSMTYTKYDNNSVDASSLQHKPELSEFASSPDTLLRTYSHWANGSHIDKEGIEFQFSSERIEVIKTRFTISGAWFKTIYKNSGAQYKLPQSPVINGKELKYVGLYDWEDGTERQQFSTNFMFDTYLQRLGLIFSTSAQCTWFTSTRNLWNDGTPIAYIDAKGESHPFANADLSDAQLKYLVQTYSDSYFDTNTVPFAMDINLKATKKFGKHVSIAVFVNKMLTVYPDYTRGDSDLVIRRQASPYFGMEANLRF